MKLLSSGNQSLKQARSLPLSGQDPTIIDGSFRYLPNKPPFKLTSLLTWSLAGLLLVNLSFQLLIFSTATPVSAMESSGITTELTDNIDQQLSATLSIAEVAVQEPLTSANAASDILANSADEVTSLDQTPIAAASEILESLNQKADLTTLGHGDGGEWIGVSLPDGRLAWVTSEPIAESQSLETLLTIKPKSLSIDNLDQQTVSTTSESVNGTDISSVVSNVNSQPPAQPVHETLTDMPSIISTEGETAGEDSETVFEEIPDKPVTYASVVPWSLSPQNEFSSGNIVQFQWEIEMTTGEGQGFEIVLWKPGQDPLEHGFGLAPPTKNTELRVYLRELDKQLGQLLEPGEYHWGVLLVETGTKYRRLAYLGGDNTLVYHPTE